MVTVRHHFRSPFFQSSSAKKVVRHSEFSEKFGILEKHHVSDDATENAWSLKNHMSTRKWFLVVNIHLRVAVEHPFLAVEGLKEALRAPVLEHVTPFNTAGHLPVARGEHSCSPPGALQAQTSNRTNVAEENS
jgi:hypothetical protein